MKFQFVLFCVLFIVLMDGALAQTCPTTVGGVEYPDLPSLTQSTDYTDIGQDGSTWIWNFCKAETTTACGETGTVVCQNYSGATRSCGVLAAQTITAGSTGATPTPSDPTDGVTFYYGKGRSSSSCGRDRQTTIYVVCDPTATTPVVISKPNEVPAGTCQYHITMKAAAACKAVVPTKCPTLVDGISFPNLNRLTTVAKPSYNAKNTNGETFYWNFCTAESGIDCSMQGSAVCQDAGFPTGFSCGLVNNQTISVGTSNNSRNGVTFNYSAGQFSSQCQRQRQTIIEVECNKTATTPTITKLPTENPLCTYHIGMQSSFACADQPQYSCCSYFEDGKFQFNSCATFDQCKNIQPYTLSSKPVANCDLCLQSGN